jgi:hypothetical protein
MPILKPLQPIPAGATIEEIQQILSTNGVLNGGFIAVRLTEFALTGDKEKLLRKGKNILSITQHSPEEIREVYNIVAANIEDSKSTFKQGLIKGFEILAQLVKSGKIKLPILK